VDGDAATNLSLVPLRFGRSVVLHRSRFGPDDIGWREALLFAEARRTLAGETFQTRQKGSPVNRARLVALLARPYTLAT
jgi:hypothetical protein